RRLLYRRSAADDHPIQAIPPPAQPTTRLMSPRRSSSQKSCTHVEPSQLVAHHLRLCGAEPLPQLALERFQALHRLVSTPPLLDEQIQLRNGGLGLVDEGRCLRTSHWASSEVFVVRNLEVRRRLCPFPLSRRRPGHIVTGV